MTDWSYIQSLLDVIEKQQRIIAVQAQVLAMYQISIEKFEGDKGESDGDCI